MQQQKQLHKTMMYPWRSLSSSSTSSSSSSFACKEVYENQVMDMREQIRREREKERIRAEIMVEEEMQRRRLGGWMGLSSSSVMLRPEVNSLGGYETRPFSNDNIYDRSMVVMPTVPEIYSHCGGSHRREEVDDEPPFQRAPRFREMDVYPTTNDDDGKTEIVGKGKPCEATDSKRKEPPQPSPPSRASSIGFGLDSITTTKKSKWEWSCDVCKISATSKNGLDEHLAGKKHQTKMAALKSPNNGGSEIGLGKVKSSVKEQSDGDFSDPKGK
uniref:uncharacterized protein LOC122598099 n=1 Tax=Erigeron canadensis TaxID=72917 RepID=UPI001CB9024B|nr:uncharacterized protein LOC122598099 [Erigeron canadensis]